MNTPIIIAIVVAVIIVAAVAFMAIRTATTSRALKGRYGDEYDRALTEHGGRAAAEAELKRRVREHDDLTLTELGPDRVEHYREAWTGLQAQFIDDPTAVVRAADGLVAELVTERGYPDVDFDQRVTHLSVEHARVLGAYRDAHTTAERSNAGWASTEDLRQALVSYRNVISDVLGDATLDTTSLDTTSAVPAPAVTDVADTDVVDSSDAVADTDVVTIDPADTDPADADLVTTDAADADVVTTELAYADVADADVTDADVTDAAPVDAAPIEEPVARKPAARKSAARSRKPVVNEPVVDAEVADPADVPEIPTVDGAEPTPADISANEGYVTASTRSTQE